MECSSQPKASAQDKKMCNGKDFQLNLVLFSVSTQDRVELHVFNSGDLIQQLCDGSSKDGKEKEIEFLQRTAAKISAKNVDEIKGIEDQSKDNIDESSKEGIPPLPGSADGSSKDGKEKEIEFLQRTAAKISAKNVDEIKGIEDQSKDNIDESSKEGIPPLPGSADGSSKDEKEKEIEFLQRTAAEISAKTQLHFRKPKVKPLLWKVNSQMEAGCQVLHSRFQINGPNFNIQLPVDLY
uniref:Uncharacterized protein n=1 Tax=Ditylenchus dipsaci TaxID=166011 RepID=A0A915DEJ0_9BILA